MYTKIKNYVARKNRGLLSTEIAETGSIVVSAKAFDNEGAELPDLEIVLVANKLSLLEKLTRLKAETDVIMAFIDAESLLTAQEIEDWQNQATPPAPVVPIVQVSMRQARLALLQAGLLDSINAAVANLSQAAQIEWEYAGDLRKDNPLLMQVTTAFGMTEAQIDDLFRLAWTL